MQSTDLGRAQEERIAHVASLRMSPA
jgi:hypothetical protein